MRRLRIAMVHAGLPPQWSPDIALSASVEVQSALQRDPKGLFKHMYGDQPDQWSESLTGYERLRFMVNCFTRLRFCDAAGRINLKLKDSPRGVRAPWLPWFKVPGRASRDVRTVCGHWSTLGYHDADNVIAIDTGCVWGGKLCSLRLDEISEPVFVDCAQHQQPGAE